MNIFLGDEPPLQSSTSSNQNEFISSSSIILDQKKSSSADPNNKDHKTTMCQKINNYIVVDETTLTAGSGGNSSNCVTVKDLTIGDSSKIRLSGNLTPSKAAKLAKILSVVEEGNSSSPPIERKYEIVTNQV